MKLLNIALSSIIIKFLWNMAFRFPSAQSPLSKKFQNFSTELWNSNHSMIVEFIADYCRKSGWNGYNCIGGTIKFEKET